jgi:hypothetical protein
MSDAPGDLPGLDPDEFVGEPPTGEADPVGFTSGDQSTSDTDDAGQSGQSDHSDHSDQSGGDAS